MNITRRDKMTVTLVATMVAVSLLMPVPGALSQTAPGYQELFQDPARTDQLTQADLPNMGRLVVLEATAMLVHARSELGDSPNAYRLLTEITTLWNAANTFTIAVATFPLESQSIQAGRLTFPELEAAFYQVSGTLGTLPGMAPRTFENLANMSRVVAVIGPLLQQSPPGPLEVVDPRAFDPVVIANQARELASAIVPLKTQVKAESGREVKLETLDREIDLLEKLIQGFERISSGGASDRDLVASYRPIRARARRINRELARVNLGGAGLNLWRTIEQLINDMETRFQIPREIVPLRTQEDLGALDPAVVAPMDRAIRDLDGLVDQIASENPRLPQRDRIQGDARNLTTRLLVVRQYLLGQAPREQVNQALVDLEMSWRQLEDRMTRPRQGNLESSQTLRREVSEVVARTREQISKLR
jgi:hypothetical protein